MVADRNHDVAAEGFRKSVDERRKREDAVDLGRRDDTHAGDQAPRAGGRAGRPGWLDWARMRSVSTFRCWASRRYWRRARRCLDWASQVAAPPTTTPRITAAKMTA